MAHRIVDRFEMVEVEAHQRQSFTPSRPREQKVDVTVKHRAIGEPSQYVIESEVGDALFAFFNLARHAVKPARQPRELIVPLDGHLAIISSGEPLSGAIESRERPGDPACGSEGGKNDDDQPEQRDQPQRPLHRPIGGERVGAGIAEHQRGTITFDHRRKRFREPDRVPPLDRCAEGLVLGEARPDRC